ncbi:CCA tRNA nucleotidyltransferase, partial [Candidatus Sumerlaeota bacterium]|nr:CCA tRNA nucleotidyltransferase [Candidatus Sumerlaeota bacterium]
MIDSAAIEIIRVLQQAGHQALIVGGAARDMMMGIPPHDYDIATSARPEEVQKLFQQTYAVGAQFGVIIVVMDNRHFEVATFRSDGAYEDGRRPADVQYCGAREDAQRRDFTINALMYDPIADEWYDYVNGQQDLQDKRIRAIGNPIMRFEEDHLRILRAFRFCFRFGFKIEKETLAAIQRLAPLTAAVSSERTSEELTRIFTGPRPGEALWALKKFGVLEHVLPEVAAMHGVPQPKEFHPEGDVLRHTCLTLDATLQLPAGRRTPELAWSALLHDIGKPPT